MTDLVTKQEPALSIASIAVLASCLLQSLEADALGLQNVAIALGQAGGQGLITRQSVFRPAKVDQVPLPATGVGGLHGTAAGVNQAEPALAAGVLGTGVGFVLNVVAGVGAMESLGVAGAVAAGQSVATRQAVWSPRTVAQRRWRSDVARLRAYAEGEGPLQPA